MPKRLNNLGSSLLNRFERLGELSDLDKAVKFRTQAVSLTPEGHPDLPEWLNNLGVSLQSRFVRSGELSDLNKGIKYTTRAVSLAPQDDSNVPKWLSNLGASLLNRFERLGELPDLDKAIEYQSQAVSLTPQNHSELPMRLSNLGSSLQTRFLRTSELSDLDNAIECITKAASLAPQDDSSVPRLLSNLGSSLLDRFERLGNRSDLDKAIEKNTQAVSLASQTHSDLPRWLSNLGVPLQSRFVLSGELSDLDEAINYTSRAVSLTPQGHQNMSKLLSNLGSSLLNRFERLGQLLDLDVAIEHHSRAVSLTPQGHSDRPKWLNNIGSALRIRYIRLGVLLDLDRAIGYVSEAVTLTPPGHSDRHKWLSNLGVLFKDRFVGSGVMSDLEEAITYTTQAVSLTPQGHSDLPKTLSNLGSSLQSRFTRLGELADLDKAIDYTIQAVSLTPRDHSSIPTYFLYLGYSYLDRSKWSGVPDDIDKSLDYFQMAAECLVGSPTYRLQSALQWARLCSEHCISSLQAYQQVMSLLPQFIWLGNAAESRYKDITDVGNVSVEAAAAALAVGGYSLALEWLEEGRSIVWKQILQLRTPIDDLLAVAPTLAAKLKQVSHDLDYASSPKSASFIASQDAPSLEQAAQNHRRLAEKWQELLDQVRGIPGFEAFLRPQKTSELMRSAQSGPIVMINLHKARCDALIIQPGLTEVLHVPLLFSCETASKTRIQFDHMVCSRDMTSRYFVKEESKPADDLGSVLNSLWVEIVRPVLIPLGYMRIPLIGALPHITWCTTGPLSFLPLHAAGNYSSGAMIFNYVIYSYMPTLSALLRPPSAVSDFSGILAVGQSATPGMAALPGTVAELTRIQEKSHGLTVTRLDEGVATPAAVLAGMENHSWVHLACHAMQNTTNPIHSSFYLHGGNLDLAAITLKQLKNADLAFLSACQTAKGDESLSEEAVHLAAGMLMAGYRTVIATMWSIGDQDAPLITEKVYEHLLEGGTPDARRAAAAVHKATECLRAKVGVKAYAKWVPYIHIGL